LSLTNTLFAHSSFLRIFAPSLLGVLMSQIALLEELSLNAYPGAGQVHYDGWALQVSPGRWRRANSVQLLHPSRLPLDEKITYCEAFYGARSKRTVFKLTHESPPDLEPALIARGYARDAVTSVQVAALPGGDSLAVFPDVTVQAEPDEAYIQAFYRIHHFEEADREPWRVIQRAILPPMGYLGLWQDGAMVAAAIGVVERGWLGVFGVGTLPAHQRRGHARRIMRALWAWGIEQGATHSYLQVMIDSPAALALYDQLGYREAYRYWYRQR
jgi:GNAT superfamily N-acetyltransferase